MIGVNTLAAINNINNQDTTAESVVIIFCIIILVVVAIAFITLSKRNQNGKLPNNTRAR